MEIPEETRLLKNRDGHPSDTDAEIAAQALLDPDPQRLLAADTSVPAAAAGTDRGNSASHEDLLDSFWQIRPVMAGGERSSGGGRRRLPAGRSDIGELPGKCHRAL